VENNVNFLVNFVSSKIKSEHFLTNIANFFIKKTLTFVIFYQELVKLLQPLLIAQILKYFSGEMELWEACIYGGAISLCSLLVGYMYHPLYMYLFKFVVRLRVACSGLIYRKVTALP
jgi:hypothetical protein